MRQEKISLACQIIAEAIRTGYSSSITFAYREILTNEERIELAARIESLASSGQQKNFSLAPNHNRLS